jgi:hypothetical protein
LLAEIERKPLFARMLTVVMLSLRAIAKVFSKTSESSKKGQA